VPAHSHLKHVAKPATHRDTCCHRCYRRAPSYPDTPAIVDAGFRGGGGACRSTAPAFPTSTGTIIAHTCCASQCRFCAFLSGGQHRVAPCAPRIAALARTLLPALPVPACTCLPHGSHAACRLYHAATFAPHAYLQPSPLPLLRAAYCCNKSDKTPRQL